MTAIQTITDDGTITAPGAYRLSMTLYHSQKVCPGPSASSTGIRKAALQSPLAFWKTSDLNPNRYPPKEESDALILGKAAHCLILGDEVFAENFVYVPDNAPKKPTAPQIAAFERKGEWSEAAAEGGPWWAAFEAEAEGRSFLTAEQVTRIGYMAENLAELPEAREALIGDLTEISLIWQDELTGLWVKSRPDCIPSNGVDFGDLKTFSPKGNDLILSAQRAVTDHGYAVQMAMAVEGAQRIFGTSATRCALIFIQTTEPYEPVPIMLDDEAIHWGRVLYRDGLNKIAHGLQSGEWPGRAKGFINYAFPPSMLHRFGEMQLNGDLPMIERISA
jgi:hypothetical protein